MKQIKKTLDDILGVIIGLLGLLLLYAVGIVFVGAIAVVLYLWLVTTGTKSIYKVIRRNV